MEYNQFDSEKFQQEHETQTRHDPRDNGNHSNSRSSVPNGGTDALSAKRRKPAVRRMPTSQWEQVVGPLLPKEGPMRKTDYVLVFRKKRLELESAEREAQEARIRFAKVMIFNGADIVEDRASSAEFVYLKIHMAFWRLCKEAEKTRIEMPIKDVSASF